MKTKNKSCLLCEHFYYRLHDEKRPPASDNIGTNYCTYNPEWILIKVPREHFCSKIKDKER